MDLPSASRRQQANSSGVIAITNTVFGSHETKILIGTWFHVVMEISSKYKRILLRNNDISTRQMTLSLLSCYSFLIVNCAIMIINNQIVD